MEYSVYEEIAARTGGDIYMGVVGPVRTGKSTLIKRLMEELVIPSMEDPYRKERARDELPQSGSGKTITTSEPKFIPEEAVEISPDGKAKLKLRMIDSVGYMIPGAVGAMEDGKPRMVATPWADVEIPLTEAAQLGTKKVMESHCSMGLVVTTDGSITDIPRADYVEAERQSILDMQATGKPFLVVVNSKTPEADSVQALCDELRHTYGVAVHGANCQAMGKEDISRMLQEILYAFPMTELRVDLPRWMNHLEYDHPIKSAVYAAIAEKAQGISALRQAEEALSGLDALPQVEKVCLSQVELGSGVVSCRLEFPHSLFYEILNSRTGLDVSEEGELLEKLTELSEIQLQYEKIASALKEAEGSGYGVVLPVKADMKLEAPSLIRKGSAYGVRIRATAPSMHLMRVDLDAEVSPMVGSELQAKELLDSLTRQYEADREQLWESNIFGKSVYEMVSDSLDGKLHRMPEEVRSKFRGSLARTVNEGASGMICILF